VQERTDRDWVPGGKIDRRTYVYIVTATLSAGCTYLLVSRRNGYGKAEYGTGPYG